MWDRGRGGPQARAIFNNFIKKFNYNIVKFNDFSRIFRQFIQKYENNHNFYWCNGRTQTIEAFNDFSKNFYFDP